MPLDMPESVLVRFKGKCSPASRCAIWCTRFRFTPSRAGPADRRQTGQEEHLLRPHPRNRRACPTSRSSRLRAALTPPPSVPQRAARSRVNEAPIVEYLKSGNIVLLKAMIADGYRMRVRWSVASRQWLTGLSTEAAKADADASTQP